MVDRCPRCGKTAPENSVYCPYCGFGIRPEAMSAQVSIGVTLMFTATGGSFVFFVLALRAILNIYDWYPVAVAQVWFLFDQILMVLVLVGFSAGLLAGTLSLMRRNYAWAIGSAIVCTFASAGAWIVSMLVVNASLVQSFLYYFLPLFAASLAGTSLIFFRRTEFSS